jgi:polyribonucleotide nucleotidyltransferase
MEAAERAREEIERLSEEVKIGRIYNGKVTSIKDFGAFIEVIPGQDGLCHISELSTQRVQTVAGEVKVGQQVRVKVIAIDDQGRIKLSRRQAILDEAPKAAPAAPAPATPNTAQPSPEVAQS